jgi:hypothetical protein
MICPHRAWPIDPYHGRVTMTYPARNPPTTAQVHRDIREGAQIIAGRVVAASIHLCKTENRLRYYTAEVLR